MQKEKFPSFQSVLENNVRGYEGEYSAVVKLAPRFFQFFINLLGSPDITPELKRYINAAIAYFVTPYDLLSEEDFGAYGYIDDVFFCAYLSRLLDKKLRGKKVLENSWPGVDLWNSVDTVLTSMKGKFGDKEVKKLLRFAGLA